MNEREGAIATVRSVAGLVQSENVTFLAAAVAYYAFVSLMPLLLLALAVASFVGGPELADRVTEGAETLLTPQAQDLVRDALTGTAGRGGATVVGLAVLTWSAIKVFRALDQSFSRIYGTAGEETLVGDIRDAVLVLGAMGVGVTAVGAASAAVAFVPGPLVDLASTAALFATLLVAFLPVYSVFPGVPVSIREALPGAAVAALGWTFLGEGIQVYAANAGGLALYGVLGAVLLVVTWLYVGALLVLVGAALNATLGDRQVQQDGVRATQVTAMSDVTADDAEKSDDVTALREEIEDLERRLEERTVSRSDLERDLKRYVRRRIRRGHARGWGPYLVLLYGTAMTLGAFYLLSGGWAVLAMLVIWLSTLGLYTLMVIVGAGLSLLSVPGRVRDAIGSWRR